MIFNVCAGVNVEVLSCRYPGIIGCMTENDVDADDSHALTTQRHETLRVTTYVAPPRSELGAKMSAKELRSERTDAAIEAPF